MKSLETKLRLCSDSMTFVFTLKDGTSKRGYIDMVKPDTVYIYSNIRSRSLSYPVPLSQITSVKYGDKRNGGEVW